MVIILVAVSKTLSLVPGRLYCNVPEPPVIKSRRMTKVSFSLILPASTSSNKATKIGNLMVLAAGNIFSPFKSR